MRRRNLSDTVSGTKLGHMLILRAMRWLVAGSVALVAVMATTQAHALPANSTVRNGNGQSMTVSQTINLNPQGQNIVVTGRGYNPTAGIYVALCKTPKRGQRPGPCGGGINTDGRNASSVWISSNPPPYGASVARPYRPNGRFRVRLFVSPMIGSIDCRVTSCAVVSRADHLRINDRRYDVVVPVTFR